MLNSRADFSFRVVSIISTSRDGLLAGFSLDGICMSFSPDNNDTPQEDASVARYSW